MRIVFDKYMLAARYLSEHPDQIGGAWVCPPSGAEFLEQRHQLFKLVVPGGLCLTQLRDCGVHGDSIEDDDCPPAFAAAIAGDTRIPIASSDIRPEDLPVFVEWQRRLDAELGEDRNG